MKLLHQEISVPTVMVELFSLTPALALSGLIDTKTPDGSKIYNTATKPLTPGKKFDGEYQGIYGLLKEYLDRVNDNDWTDTVSVINMYPNKTHEPITEYKNLAI